jgi:hypothetical protein
MSNGEDAFLHLTCFGEIEQQPGKQHIHGNEVSLLEHKRGFIWHLPVQVAAATRRKPLSMSTYAIWRAAVLALLFLLLLDIYGHGMMVN